MLQIAAHESIVPTPELIEICARARRELPAEHEIGRVIARPFRGEPGHFERTDGRKDFAIETSGRFVPRPAARGRGPGPQRR